MEPEPQDFELLSPRIPQASSPSRDEERLSGSLLTRISRQPTPNSVQGPNPDNSSKPSGQVDRSAVPNVPVLRYGQRTASKFRFRINSSSTVTQLGEYS